jgi:hypothetical protein
MGRCRGAEQREMAIDGGRGRSRGADRSRRGGSRKRVSAPDAAR